MQTSEISDILESSPCIKLVKSRNAEFILCFLSEAFSKETAITSERLHILLENKLEESEQLLEEDEEEKIAQSESSEDKAKRWIKNWTDSGFLSNYQDESGVVMYERSSHTNKVIDWIETLKKEEYIGTESKFKTLFSQLKELVEYSNEDKQKRLSILKDKRLKIEHEIQRLEMGEDVQVFEDYEIIPRFSALNKLAKELLSDFKEVDDNFKEIIKEIYKRQINKPQKKEIINYIFDAYTELKESSQGKSFYSFWEFLGSNELKDQWDELVDELFKRLEEKGLNNSDVFLKNMRQYLFSAGKKVVQTNDKMSEKLSKLIRFNEKSNAEISKKIFDDIKQLLLNPKIKQETPKVGLEYEDINLFIPFDRQLQLRPIKDVEYKNIQVSPSLTIDQLESLGQLFNSHIIDSKILKDRINKALTANPQQTLGAIIQANKLTKGLSEIFGYIGVLSNYRTIVNEEKTQEIVFDDEQHKSILIPEIIVLR